MRTFFTAEKNPEKLGVRTFQKDSSLLGFQRKQSITVLHTRASLPLRFAPLILVRKVLNDSFCFGTQ